MKLLIFWLPYFRLPIIDLLTNVLIVYAMLVLPSGQLVINVDVLIEAGLEYKPGLEYRPGVWSNCTNRGRGLLFEEIRYKMFVRIWYPLAETVKNNPQCAYHFANYFGHLNFLIYVLVSVLPVLSLLVLWYSLIFTALCLKWCRNSNLFKYMYNITQWKCISF